jgi:hypothetical protein
MTAAQNKAARHRKKLRYRGGHSHISIGEAVDRERQKQSGPLDKQAVSRKKKS